MKRILLLLVALGASGAAHAIDFTLGFSPGGTALKDVVTAIDAAQEQVLVAAYEFTSEPVAQALVRAAARGVKVSLVMDEKASKDRRAQAGFLAAHGVAVRIDGRYAIFHHKFLVVDGATVETGSFNYTASADTRNAENALVLRGVPDLASAYQKEWQRLWAEARPWSAP